MQNADPDPGPLPPHGTSPRLSILTVAAGLICSLLTRLPMRFFDATGMSPILLAVVAAATVTAYLVLSTALQYRKLRHVKGPWLASISPLWMFYHTFRGRLYLAVDEALAKYGSPVRVAPDYIVTWNPETMRAIHAPRSEFVRSRWYDGMRLGAERDNVLTVVDENVHADVRAKLMPGYTGKEVPNMEADVDASVIELIKVIHRDYIAKNQVMDFSNLAGFFTMDILTKIAFGLSLGFLTKNEDLFEYHKTLKGFVPIMELGSNHPTILAVLNSSLVQWLVGPKPEDKTGQGPLLAAAHKAVAEHFANASDAKTQGQTMISSFIRHGLTQKECEDESMLLILAGAESTSTALRMTVLYILSTPKVYHRLNQEIAAALERGAVSFPVIKASEAQSLPYLQATVREGLRIFAPLHGLASRTNRKKDVTINGVFIPAGTECGTAQYSMFRRKDIFGIDADSFNPDRWLDKNTELVRQREKVQDLVFGSGSATCLGKNVAQLELNKAIFELLRNFDLQTVNPIHPVQVRSNAVVVLENMLLRVSAKETK